MCLTGSNNGSPYYRRGIHPRVLGAGTINLESSPNGIWTHKSCATNRLAVNSKPVTDCTISPSPQILYFIFLFQMISRLLAQVCSISILMLCRMFFYNVEELCTIRSVICIYILRHMLKQTTSLFNTSESHLQIYLIIFRHTTAGQGLALYRPAAANITNNQS